MNHGGPLSTHRENIRFERSGCDSNGESSFERKEEGVPLGGEPTPKNDTLWRLSELHTNILSTAEVMKQVQTEVLSLRQENETLRKKLSLVGSSDDEGGEPGSRSSVGSVSTVVGKKSDAPMVPAAPALMERLDLKVAQSCKDNVLRDDGSTSVPMEASETLIVDSRADGADSHKGKIASQGLASSADESDILLFHVGKPDRRAHEGSDTANRFSGFAASTNFSRASKRDSQRLEFSITFSQVAAQRARAVQETRRTAVRAMVFDPYMVKEKLRENITKPDFNVTTLYHQRGCAQRIARSRIFEIISMGFICANTLWIAVDTQHNQADVLLDADIGFQVVEHIFCTFFLVEILIRFAAFQKKQNCIWSGWFIFDGLLVLTMVIEDWIVTVVLLGSRGGTGGTGKSVSAIKNAAMLRILRLLRLLRLGRFLRLMRQSPEIMIIIKAVYGSMRCVLWTCALQAGVTFFFGVCFTQLCKDTRLEDEYFPSLAESLHTLTIVGMFPDSETLSRSLNSESIFLWFIFVLYLTTTSICVLNMLIGMLCEVVSHSSKIQRDAMDVGYVKEVFIRVLCLTEKDDITSICINKQEAFELLQKAEISEALTKVGIDVLGLVDLMDFIFFKGDVSIASLLEIFLQLRSSAALTVKDIVEVRKFLAFEMSKITQELKQLGRSGQHALKLRFGDGREEVGLDQRSEAGSMSNQAKAMIEMTERFDAEMQNLASKRSIMRV